ncbi:segregation and condensation protein A [Liquorilactobacillus mali]|uniref:Segregation and condensation protein A n=1 Tax=Liquorilactobacillus mali KCTC 3596 = DSM 20444 TaxID=1046596 RepID=J0UQY1_9LACO|nr:segregation/condensation protein A [Liquorilactobacillus mali]EJE98483.1 segregation and condensation protein A [Liquorilactobacillus mali KCTC 3596 = DSM 20444]KRN09556.1 segregation and condensation protein A [Liquorilactobacillus mali KCTC 3596 = DSM 20444]MDC7952157.1 segregation/condensation protein A [Liquorilactobacillus mali]QFQ74754.1 RNA 3-phosphate cyclase [Liquorilactobacillus mali]
MVTSFENQKLTFKIKSFEGPLDLLLHLIKQNQMDIYDIPMTEITSQYIEKLHQMQTMELDIAGEYLVMASTLLNIKSKMLLPNHDELEDAETIDDPRLELVQQLLEHQCYQMAAENLDELFESRALHYTREQADEPCDTRKVLLSGSQPAVLLKQTFVRLLASKKTVIAKKGSIRKEHFTIEGEMTNILYRLLKNGSISFDSLIIEQEVQVEKIVTCFLAMLELVKRGTIEIIQKQSLDTIILRSVVNAINNSSGD